MRPAINAGLSVSRVGGAAQTKAMKKIAGPIRVELAQYRELAAFSQFGSDLDKETRDRLAQGERIIEVLKQPQYTPKSVADQILILYAATRKYLMDVEVTEVARFQEEFIDFIDTKYSDLKAKLAGKDGLTKELDQQIAGILDEFMPKFKKSVEKV